MKTTYKRELERNYLILEQEDFQNSYQIGMLVKNRIPGLLECRLSLVDRRAAFYYEITSRKNLRLVLDRKRLRDRELEALLRWLLQTAGSCEEYLLDTKGLILNPDYIYLDPDVWECSFCLFPFYEGDLRDGLFDLAEYLLDLNATGAARRAGYSKKTADRIGPELLGKTCYTMDRRKGA